MIFVTLFFALAFLCVYISKKVFNDWFSPISIMGFVWFMVLGMFHLRLYPYNPLDSTGWLSVIGGLLFFGVGSVLAVGVIIGNRTSSAVENPRVMINQDKLYRLIKIFWILGILGFLPLIIKLILTFGADVFIDDPTVVRQNFSVRFFGYLWLLNTITPVLAYIYMRIQQRRRLLMMLIIFSCLMMLLASFSRTNALRCIVMMFLCETYLKLSTKSLRNLFITTCAILAIFVTVSYVRTPDMHQRLERTLFEPEFLKPLAPAYGYLTTPLPTFEAMVNEQKKFDYGINTFVTVVHVLRLFNIDVELPEWPGRYYANPVRCNVTTYLGPLYKDYGLYGVIIFSVLIGMMTMYFYLRMVRYGAYHYFLFNSFLGWCLFISFFSNHFVGNSAFFIAIMSIICGKYIVRPYKEGILTQTER